MDKRSFLRSAGAMLAAAALPLPARASQAPTRLLAGWRSGVALPGPATGEPGDYVGVVEIDWSNARILLRAAVPVASRGHGLVGLPGGQGYLAQAYRHGHWLMRVDADGRVAQTRSLPEERGRVSGGHLALMADGQHVCTSEIEPQTSEGWISIRRIDTLAKVAEWPTRGRDPHQILSDQKGRLLIANGGIRYAPDGRKGKVDDMASSLVQIDPASGAMLGQWQVRDQRLSLRHLAWNETPQGETLLGIAMQGEHDDPAQRKAAPVLAVWNGQEIRIPTASPIGEGYTGDIMAGPGGGFILSAQLSGRALLWHPGDAARMQLIGEFHRAGALTGPDAEGGFMIAGEKGPARWHLRDKAQMLAWPIPLSPDNHWALLDA